MPFLRRRGNMASESDMRRQSTLVDRSLLQEDREHFDERPDTDAATHHDVATPPTATSSSLLEPSRSFDQETNPRPSSHEIPRPGTPPVQDETPKHRRFSILRFRNASDSQLSLRARQQADNVPPVPKPPEIITTAPTAEVPVAQKKQSRLRLADRFRKSGEIARHNEDGLAKNNPQGRKQMTVLGGSNTDDLLPPVVVTGLTPESSSTPPQTDTGDVVSPTPANVGRASESSRSDISAATHPSIANPTKQTTSSGFFWLPRRKAKPPIPLFDLSHLPQKGRAPHAEDHITASSSTLGFPHSSASRDSILRTQNASRPSSSYSGRAESAASSTVADPSAKQAVAPATAHFHPDSTHSGHSSPTRSRLHLRGRSSTMSSLGRDSTDDHLSPGTTRTSSSTGRKSLGDVFGLNRLRQTTDLAQTARQGTLTPMTPGSSTSKNNSLHITRESITLPDRRDDESAVKYLARIEQSLSRGVIASALSRGTDPFYSMALRSYMRRFSFFGDPMDMAIRKLLMEAELPKETQQIDRCLQAFANRYHECNPGIYASPDQAYFIAFSLLILHTDVFNKNNKYKMQQADYIKNTRGEGVYEPILKCFYDNITYTPFIHVEDEIDLTEDRQRTRRRTRFPGGTPDKLSRKSSKEPLDPYMLILDGKLDALRPSLKDVMELDDHYSYLGTAKSLNVRELQRTFFRTGVLQILSARSRPDAFREGNGTTNPDTAPQGVVDIKITKVGLLWRKDVKKKKTRPRWQEWGAILTGAQLYFFRNTTWVKSLMHQYESHIKQGYYGEPITFKPQLAEFKPDAFMPIKEAVALVDHTYKKHKYAFKYARPAAFVEEVLLADNEDEMNDWLAKLNYAAAFMTSGVRMRGVVGSHYEGQTRRGIRRLDSSNTAKIIQTPTGEVSIISGKIDHKEAESILLQRHQSVETAVSQSALNVATKEKELEDDLRNARHLQILSPIQAKSREELLREAARMDVKIKWIRMDIWRMKCHSDVLERDLEEEDESAAAINLTPTRSSKSTRSHDGINGSIGGERHLTEATESRLKATGDGQHSAQLPLSDQPSTVLRPDGDTHNADDSRWHLRSPLQGSHKHQRSWDSSLSPSAIVFRTRSGSSTRKSSGTQPAQNTRAADRPQTPNQTASVGETSDADHNHVLDAGERDLLEKAGLLESPSSQTLRTGRGRGGSVSEVGEPSEHRDPMVASDRQDKMKVRRSLQRTLRESAGHLSHHRSKKGRDSASSGISEDTIRDDMLNRGTGSFVVHGKKASVINFGEGLQHLPTEERLRQRLQRDEPVSPSSTEEEFYDAPGFQPDAERRRESAASASTATARSFRELHRKYSTAQATKTPNVGGKLSVPSDTESEAAISISEGRRTPLPPIENEHAEDDEQGQQGLPTAFSSSRSLVAASVSEPSVPFSPSIGDTDQNADEASRLTSSPIQAMKA